jgi:hypothetical protein
MPISFVVLWWVSRHLIRSTQMPALAKLGRIEEAKAAGPRAGIAVVISIRPFSFQRKLRTGACHIIARGIPRRRTTGIARRRWA